MLRKLRPWKERQDVFAAAGKGRRDYDGKSKMVCVKKCESVENHPQTERRKLITVYMSANGEKRTREKTNQSMYFYVDETEGSTKYQGRSENRDEKIIQNLFTLHILSLT